MDRTEESIAIPHFINPQLFWYHNVDGQNPAYLELQRFEESVQSQYSAMHSVSHRPYRPQVGEIVAIAFVSWNKYIRARVDHVVQFTRRSDEYVVWALDYGFPLQTEQCHVRKLPDTYTRLNGHIRMGGVANIIPAELDYDFGTFTSRICAKDMWSKRAVEMLEKVINDAASISFIESFCEDIGVSERQHFGDLKITNHTGDAFFVSDYLIKLNYAVECRGLEFRNKLSTLKTNKIPCWETNSRQMKIIENKLNTFNLNYAFQGKFDLSGSLSETHCDTVSKQKVIDWHERNQHFSDKNDQEPDSSCPTLARLDATDISFDDSVSVKNCKSIGMASDETIMGSAGALHASRRKKYDGKDLPPKPGMEVFEIKMPKDAKKGDVIKSSGSTISVQSQRVKTLIELRKKHLNQVQNKKDEDIPVDEMSKLNVSSSSEGGTAEFLETCKLKNALSARMQKLKELRRRRAEDASSTNDNTIGNEFVESNVDSVSTLSSRLLRLKEIKEKHSIRKDVGETHSNTPDRSTDIEIKAETQLSTHASKMVNSRKRKQTKENTFQQVQSEVGWIDKNAERPPTARGDKHGYKMPIQCKKYIKNEFSNSFEQYVESPSEQPMQTSTSQVEELKLEDDSVTPTAADCEVDLETYRKMVKENPYQTMTMVPGGFNLQSLVKRRNEDSHWHTKRSTLNESLQSNYSDEEFQCGAGFNDSSMVLPTARRTENVKEKNFRLTGSRKERKKAESDVKYILDMSLNDIVCAPVIAPVVVSDNLSDEPKDLLVFNDSNEGKASTIKNSCLIEQNKPDKLIYLSANSEVLNVSLGTASVSSDSFVKFVQERSSVKNTSKEQLLESSDESIDLLSINDTVKYANKENVDINSKDTSSSISSGSFTKLENITQNPQSPKDWLKQKLNNPILSYEASSSSDSSGSMSKIEMANKSASSVSPSPVVDVVKNATSDFPANPLSETSSLVNLAASPNQSQAFDKEAQSLLIKPQTYSTNKSSLVMSPVTTPTQSNKFPSHLLRDPQSYSSSLSGKSPAITPTHSLGLRMNKFPSSFAKSNSSSTLSSSPVRDHSPQVGSTQALPPYDRTTNSSSKSSECGQHLPEVAGEATLKTNLIQHLVLAHSNVKVTPISCMNNALFSPEIHQEMENMRLTKMYRIQAYAWAHLVRGNSFFVINTSRTGRTWCYLPPVCSMIAFRLETQCLPQTYGPVAIIIAPSSDKVESISRHCRRLLASTETRVSVVPSYAFRNAEEVKIELHNGCGILIITPPNFQRLLEANEKENLLNMERIQYVVIDDLDTMMSQDDKFDETLQKFIGNQKSGNVPYQLVVTSKTWSSQRMVNLLKISNQPLLCIADYLEAAVYAKTKLSIKLQRSTEKIDVVIKYLEKCPYGLERVMIMCSSQDEVAEVERYLQESGYSCLAYTERMSVEYSNLIAEWKVKTICHQILITTDTVLPELMVQNVWTVIHYSLPTSWTKFNFRFSAFLQNYENRITTQFKKQIKVPTSLILLDENNNIQLPRLIEFMKHHNQLKHIHPDILSVAANVTAEREESRVVRGILMCPNILEFGSCDQNSRCTYRHQLTKYDKPVEGIPTHGELRLKILDVVSPTHYIARLLTYKNGNTWEIARRSNEVTYFLMQLSMHFMSDDAHIVHWPLKVNDICVYKGEEIFHRCRLVEVPTIVHENIVKLVNVKVKLIDSGATLMCKSYDIFVIPDKFKDFPPQAMDIRLSGVIPFDNERAWDSRSTRTVKKWIMTDITENHCLQASINFALMDTIWVTNVILMEKLPTIRGYAVKINLRRSLLGKEFGLADDGMPSVKQIAMDNGLLSPAGKQDESAGKYEEHENLLEFSASSSWDDKDTSTRSELPDQVTPESVTKSVPKSAKKVSVRKVSEEWMQLELDELLQVKIGQFHDPNKFYVRLLSKEDDTKELEDMIRNEKKMPLVDPYPMQNCLAPRDDHQYYRAKIQRLIVDSNDGCVQARVFFCDLGLFSKYPLEQLCASSKAIVEYIPFQAVCCKLTGLHTECVGEDVQKIIQIEDSIHFAYAVKESSDVDHNDDGFYIRKYEIILYECFTDKNDVQINKLLVEHGLAEYDVETKHFLELESKLDLSNFDYEEGQAEKSFDFQEFLNRVKQQMDEEDAEDEMYNSSLKMGDVSEIEGPKIEEITTHSIEKDEDVKGTKTGSPPPTLRSIHKRPLTTWYETMCMIYLVIRAPDICDYHLEITPKRLVFVADVNGEQNMLILDLLGYVEPNQSTHEIRGLNVVVRLVKSVFMQWPRLLEDPTKFSWLTYNYNAIDVMDAEKLIDGTISRTTRGIVSYSSEDGDSETSESIPCENFTPIMNLDELHDPMRDVY